ncbi:ATP-binding protein [Streptomyces jeddahensis]|uniref:Histidine kinase/HSP90-like ATPase domain-containing protein n=1 Tax=Streptomyces jeddahensis TaxID=1716141 RepID=A0A177HIN6_9ACTN|nr:ATP-binding protein [Streptomyces jeddahensis]OAH10247.1 hypothetical protein STSP_65030 [Streptomyces jeddahensis]
MTSSVDAVETQLPTTVRAFRQRFSSTRRGARLVCLLAVEQLSSWGIEYGSDLSDSAALIVAELAANAVTHGRVPGRDFEVRLTLAPDSGVLCIAVSDATARHKVSTPKLGYVPDASWRAAALFHEIVSVRPLPARNPAFAAMVAISYMHASGEGLAPPYGGFIDLAKEARAGHTNVYACAELIRSWRV